MMIHDKGNVLYWFTKRHFFDFTVKKHLSQLYHRFGVTNRTGLIHKFKSKA